jgi:CheY-like chemotaxis protein/anti-sigma regulatory factor (Ser/Thr protein kinase)
MATRAEIALEVAPHGAELPFVLADRTRLSQILMNFGSNAIKYGRKGGRVTFLVDASQGAIRLSVKDDGNGIAERHRSRLFEPFQRAGQEGGPIEGTGIGLAISKRLAGLMDGTVGFETEVGVGSVFWVEVPAQMLESVRDPTTVRAAMSHGTHLTDGVRKTVVYIEDNPANIAFMRDMLGEYASIELVTAPTAEIGLELCRSRHPALVIMDINLPGMSGLEATRRLSEWPETQGIPVVGLSAAAMSRDTERAKRAGFYRYLTKPIQVDELTRVLEEILAGS